MDIPHIARLAMDVVAPDTMHGLLDAIEGILDDSDEYLTRILRGERACLAIMERRDLEPVPDGRSLETWASIPWTGGENPLATARVRTRDVFGPHAARAGIVATMVAAILDPPARGDLPRLARAGIHTWRPGNDLIGDALAAPGERTAYILAEPTGMVPCTVEKAHGHLRVVMEAGSRSQVDMAGLAGAVAARIRHELEPRHDLYDLHGNPAIAAKFLVGATVATVSPGPTPGIIDAWYEGPPLDASIPATVEAAIHRAVSSEAPGARARITVLDASEGSIARPDSWLLDRFSSLQVTSTGEHPYLDWHAGWTMAPMLPPSSPWLVLGPGSEGPTGKVSFQELAAFGSLLARMQGEVTRHG